jgi:Uma2 family endonuclease
MATVREAKRATVDDLYRTPGKVELVNGEVVLMSPTGAKPGAAANAIFVSLYNHARRTGNGRAVGDNKGFVVALPIENRSRPMPPTGWATIPG